MKERSNQRFTQMPAITSISIKAIIMLLSLSCILISKAQAAYFIDNSASGCSNGNTSYNPLNRTCTGGSDTVFTSLGNAVNGVPSGSQGNPTVINIRSGSTYNMSSVVNISKAWTTWQKYASDTLRPILDWKWSWNSNWSWGAMIEVRANGVTIDALEIKNAGYGGSSCSMASAIKIGDGDYKGAGYSDVTVKNCYIHHIGNSGVEFFNSVNISILNNEFYECQYAQLEHGGNCWAASITSSFNTNNVTISGNLIHESGGEGMNLNRWATNYTISNNTVYNVSMPALFINGMQHATVSGNLVYHTGASRYTGYHAGIMVAAEAYGVPSHTYDDADDIDVRGNMIAGTMMPLGIAEAATEYGYKVRNTRFENNTVIEPLAGHSAFVIQNDAVGSGVEVKQNIFWQNTSTTAIASIPSGITFAENLWSKKPPTSAQSASDPRYSSYPAMPISSYFNKTTGWNDLTPGELRVSDFNLLPTATYAYIGDKTLGYVYVGLRAPTLSVK